MVKSVLEMQKGIKQEGLRTAEMFILVPKFLYLLQRFQFSYFLYKSAVQYNSTIIIVITVAVDLVIDENGNLAD